MEGLLYLAVGVCSVMLIVSVIAYLCAIFLVISRTEDRAEERELSWGERAGRATAGSAGSSSPMNLDRYVGSYSVLRWGRLDRSASFCC